jgi:uncharacterized protein YkwD
MARIPSDPDTDPDADPDPDAGTPDPVTSGGGGGGGGGGSTGGGDTMPVLPGSAYDIGWAGLSAEEQLIVEMINRARMDPQSEVVRLSEPLASGISSSPAQPLAVVETLSDAADAHSRDMDDRNFFSHTNPDGESPADRAIDAGHGSRFVGENIGWIGSTSTSFDLQDRAEAHHENLWESDGHQANLMSGNWDEIGVGYDYGSHQGFNGSTFVTEMFGNRGETYLTGVVIEDSDSDKFYDIGEGQADVRITAWDGTNAYATATWNSGGYTLALPPGTYTVRFEGGDLDAPYETTVRIGTENVKLDVIDAGGSMAASLTVGSVSEEAGLPLMRITDNLPVDDAAELEELELV